MDCREIKKMLPVFLDGELESVLENTVADHLRTCPQCRREAEELQKAWDLLGELEPIEPDPFYRTRFWARVAEQEPWPRRVWESMRHFFGGRYRLPALAAAAVLLVVSVFAVQRYQQSRQIAPVAEIGAADLELVQNLDLAENYDLIQQLDWIADLEIIENLDQLQDSQT